MALPTRRPTIGTHPAAPVPAITPMPARMATVHRLHPGLPTTRPSVLVVPRPAAPAPVAAAPAPVMPAPVVAAPVAEVEVETARLECVLPADLKAEAQLLAIKWRVSMSEVVRRGLVRAVETGQIGPSHLSKRAVTETVDAQWTAYLDGTGPHPLTIRTNITPRTV